MSLRIAVELVLVCLILSANSFYVLSLFATIRFFRGRESSEAPLPPVTIMVPLHGADFKAYENYALLCRQEYPEYQIVFGVLDNADSSIPLIERLQTSFPEVDIELVICGETIGENLKVSNLQNMLSRVKHETIVILDSDIRVTPTYLRRVVTPLNNQRVGLVTCLYRAAEAPDFAARLEAIGLTAEFMPGVLSAWLLEGVRFALGSTMATTRSRLESIGGFYALANYLADDFMLGNLIAREGYEVRLSDCVVETMLPPVGFAAVVRHQTRWARSTRMSRPMGYLGLILTQGTALAVLNLVASGASIMSIRIICATLIVRTSVGWLIGVHYLRDRILGRNLWLLPVRDLFGLGIWILGLFGRRVEWRGRLFEIVGDGKIVQVGAQASR
jgi:ceramide glucosyltransferase